MKRSLSCLAIAAVALLAAPAFAETDTTSTPDAVTPTADAGSTSDAGVADGGGTSDAGTTVDAGGPSQDAVSPSDASTGTDKPFNQNPCWDEKCPAETAKCKDDKNCNAFVGCLKTGKSANDCGTELKLTEAEGTALNALLNPMQECGWAKCSDPTKGTCKDQCGKYLGRSAPCNCDDECKKYGDCCADYDTLCSTAPGADSCKDKCGTYDKDAKCQCDDECGTQGDCCTDYKALCEGTACVPKCDGKKCGDDGCGGTCGACGANEVCDATGQCQVKGGTDAGPTTDAGNGGVTDAGTAADAGTGGGTVAKAASSSGGCTAAPSSNGALPFGLVITFLVGALLLRRREA